MLTLGSNDDGLVTWCYLLFPLEEAVGRTSTCNISMGLSIAVEDACGKRWWSSVGWQRDWYIIGRLPHSRYNQFVVRSSLNIGVNAVKHYDYITTTRHHDELLPSLSTMFKPHSPLLETMVIWCRWIPQVPQTLPRCEVLGALKELGTVRHPGGKA